MDECWEWQAAKDGHGYGAISADGARRTLQAHRVSYELANGLIPAGMHVLHRCDNPSCVNPGHLFTGTHADNMRDMGAKGRLTHRKKLTVDEVRAICEPTGSTRAIARKVGVSADSVRRTKARMAEART